MTVQENKLKHLWKILHKCQGIEAGRGRYCSAAAMKTDKGQSACAYPAADRLSTYWLRVFTSCAQILAVKV